jgi:hypothetical protein
MLEKEAQHFPRRVRPALIGIGTRRAASGPGVAGTVDVPVLQDRAFVVYVGCAGIAMPTGYLPAMRLLLRPGRSDGLLNRLNQLSGCTVLSRSP